MSLGKGEKPSLFSSNIQSVWNKTTLDYMQTLRARKGDVVNCQTVNQCENGNENRKPLTTTIRASSTLSQTHRKRSVRKNVKKEMLLERVNLVERERVGKQGECSYDFDCPSKHQDFCYSEDQCRYKLVMAKDGTRHWVGWESQGVEIE